MEIKHYKSPIKSSNVYNINLKNHYKKGVNNDFSYQVN